MKSVSRKDPAPAAGGARDGGDEPIGSYESALGDADPQLVRKANTGSTVVALRAGRKVATAATAASTSATATKVIGSVGSV